MGVVPRFPDPAVRPAADDDLMVRCGRGDVAAFGALLERHGGAAYRYCWRIFRNHHTAEDLAQECFVKLFRSAPNYQPSGRFTTFFYRVLTNLCFDALRRKKRRGKVETLHLDPVESEGTELEPLDRPRELLAGLLAAEAREEVHRALGALPVQVRQCLELREFEGLSYKQIAEVLDLSAPEVKVLLHRGRKMLAHALEDTPVGRAFGVERGGDRGSAPREAT
jgi:RNA polymerase sigma-70 factor (ECF subfamily)